MYNSANQDKVLQRTTPSITRGYERERGEEKVREMNGMEKQEERIGGGGTCLLYTSPSPRDATLSRMPSSA